MNEVWIPVKGYEGFYECSTEGRIKSLPKLLPKTIKRGAFWTIGQILNPKYLNPDGYLLVTLYDGNNKANTKSIHTFIFYSFNPNAKPKRGFEIDHLDNDKLNNRPNNLNQITSRANSTKRSLQKIKSSKYTGVYWDSSRNKWHSSIRINKKTISLGRYADEAQAAEAYQAKLKTL